MNLCPFAVVTSACLQFEGEGIIAYLNSPMPTCLATIPALEFGSANEVSLELASTSTPSCLRACNCTDVGAQCTGGMDSSTQAEAYSTSAADAYLAGQRVYQILYRKLLWLLSDVTVDLRSSCCAATDLSESFQGASLASLRILTTTEKSTERPF